MAFPMYTSYFGPVWPGPSRTPRTKKKKVRRVVPATAKVRFPWTVTGAKKRRITVDD